MKRDDFERFLNSQDDGEMYSSAYDRARQAIIKYDGDDVHINCYVEDQVGMDMDNDFGASS